MIHRYDLDGSQSPLGEFVKFADIGEVVTHFVARHLAIDDHWKTRWDASGAVKDKRIEELKADNAKLTEQRDVCQELSTLIEATAKHVTRFDSLPPWEGAIDAGVGAVAQALDEARAEVERLKAAVSFGVRDLKAVLADVRELNTQADRTRDANATLTAERDALSDPKHDDYATLLAHSRAEGMELRAEVEQLKADNLNIVKARAYSEDTLVAERDDEIKLRRQALSERDEARSEVERLRLVETEVETLRGLAQRVENHLRENTHKAWMDAATWAPDDIIDLVKSKLTLDTVEDALPKPKKLCDVKLQAKRVEPPPLDFDAQEDSP